MSLAMLMAGPVMAGAQASESSTEDDLPDAVWLRPGSVANRQIVAIGRDLLVQGEALQSAAVLQGDARIEGSVREDVIVLGGSVLLSETARVGGDVYALGGEVESSPGARIEGRVAAYPDAPSTLLVLIEGPALGLAPFSRPVLAAKTAVLLAWLLLGLALGAVDRGAALRSTRDVASGQPLLAFFVGLVALSSVGVGFVLFSAFAPPAVGIPIVLVASLLALCLKVWGTVAILDSVGASLLARLRLKAAPPAPLVLGVVGVGALKYIPYLGTVTWSALTLVAVGAALLSRFGTRDTWIPS